MEKQKTKQRLKIIRFFIIFKENQRTNDVATAPPINQPQPNVNLMPGLAAAQRQAESEQTKEDEDFFGF